jgi:hypothetical protein
VSLKKKRLAFKNKKKPSKERGKELLFFPEKEKDSHVESKEETGISDA